MRAHLVSEPTTWILSELRAALDPSVALTEGEAVPEGVEVLVCGRPTRAQLDRCRRALVIPYAGLPRRTRRLLAARPELAVYNLHHNAAAAAETAIALALAVAKRLKPMDRALARGDWRPRYAPDPALGLEGAGALVLGYGAIGRRVVRGLRGLGLDVQAIRRRPDGAPGVHPPAALPDLLPAAQILVICLPGTDATAGLIDASALALLPEGACLINVGRASVVDEGALYAALASGRLGGAGLDVWWRYPRSEADREDTPPSRLPFHELDNVILSPHRAGHTAASERLRWRHLAALLSALARGEAPGGRVDVEAGY